MVFSHGPGLVWAARSHTRQMTFPRSADERLAAWFAHRRRKPLILRGARQTGKTTAVRRLGERAPLLVELNLERPDDLALVRRCRSAAELLERLETRANLAELPRNAILFLDEIQEYPEALKWLRFFFEDRPGLAVVAAGSLLEVRLRREALPFPVGRVEFLRLEPLTFLEFLRATDAARLADDLEQAFDDGGPVAESLHELAMDRFREFLLVGGLPEAVDVWQSSSSYSEVGMVHTALRQAYAEDLLKYRVGGTTRYLEVVLAGAPAHYGARFKVRQLAPGEKDKPVTEALDLLEQAMILFRVRPTASRSLPLVPRRRAAHKLLPLDIGLALSELGVRPEHLAGKPVESILDGRIAEAVVGIQLLASNPEGPRQLSFWTREGGARSNAQVDYLVPTAGGVVPVEVKAGASGSLKSMHQFLAGGEHDVGVRLSSARGGLEQLEVGLGDGRTLTYRLRSVPLYLAELVARRSILGRQAG